MRTAAMSPTPPDAVDLAVAVVIAPEAKGAAGTIKNPAGIPPVAVAEPSLLEAAPNHKLYKLPTYSN